MTAAIHKLETRRQAEATTKDGGPEGPIAPPAATRDYDAWLVKLLARYRREQREEERLTAAAEKAGAAADAELPEPPEEIAQAILGRAWPIADRQIPERHAALRQQLGDKAPSEGDLLQALRRWENARDRIYRKHRVREAEARRNIHVQRADALLDQMTQQLASTLRGVLIKLVLAVEQEALEEGNWAALAERDPTSSAALVMNAISELHGLAVAEVGHRSGGAHFSSELGDRIPVGMDEPYEPR